MAKTVISYIPALHQGYLNFLEQRPGKLLVMGKKFVLETPRLERDIRAIEPEVVAEMIKSTGLMLSVDVLDDINALVPTEEYILPDEDVNRNFAEKYLQGYNLKFEPTFLRWEGHNTKKLFKAQPSEIITTKQLDRQLMTRAEAAADKSPDWWRKIGGLIARDGKVLLVGHNRPLPEDDYWPGIFGDPRINFDYGESIDLSTALHAEIGLIAEAAKKGLTLEGTSLYVTTFPCPGCAKAVAASGIKKVYYRQGYSLLDAEDILKSHQVDLILVK